MEVTFESMEAARMEEEKKGLIDDEPPSRSSPSTSTIVATAAAAGSVVTEPAKTKNEDIDTITEENLNHDLQLVDNGLEEHAAVTLSNEREVVRVIMEQEIYDLVCPSCSSCITKRVILRRRIPPPTDPLPPPTDPLPPPTDPLPPPTDPPRPPTDPLPPPIFQCLSCLTYFCVQDEDGRPVVCIPIGQCITGVGSCLTTERICELDISKSIVYGGLIELITSLGIVSSAVASDATTLNVVILGLANLMSGLIIIIHNIRDMKTDQRKATGEGNLNIDRYEETLGRRTNYGRHAIFAVMSYLVFGLLPPITYGFSFRESDDKLYKLIATGTAALVSVILLSIGKAHHDQRSQKPYLKTIMYYLIAAVSGPGLCYGAGLLLQRLIEETGWFDTSSTASTGFLETRAMKSSRWEFYR